MATIDVVVARFDAARQDSTLKNAAKFCACAFCAFLRLTNLPMPVILAPSYGLEAVSKTAR
jgi:hypothetical protein